MTTPHPDDCSCEPCCLLAAEVETTLDYPFEVFLQAAWSAWLSADTDPPLRSQIWSLIVHVETAHKDGEVDGHAEDELRKLVRPLLVVRRVMEE